MLGPLLQQVGKASPQGSHRALQQGCLLYTCLLYVHSIACNTDLSLANRSLHMPAVYPQHHRQHRPELSHPLPKQTDYLYTCLLHVHSIACDTDMSLGTPYQSNLTTVYTCLLYVHSIACSTDVSVATRYQSRLTIFYTCLLYVHSIACNTDMSLATPYQSNIFILYTCLLYAHSTACS